MNKKGKIIRVAGPLIQAVDLTGVKMYEVVNVGKAGLIGEVIEIQGDVVSVQVYEETGGIAPGEPVTATGSPLTVELGPGLIQSIYDGIQRPLEKVREKTGDYILRGVRANGLSREKKWDFKPLVSNGTAVEEFAVLGTVKESEAVESKIMVPPGASGKVSGIKAGSFLVTDEICKIGDTPVQMMFKWPVRTPLPYTKKIQPTAPLVTGTRVIDSFFPVAKGGTGCIPGPFGSGKCVSGDTPVFLADGKIMKMKDIYEKFKHKGKQVIKKDEDFTVINEELFVYGWKDGKIDKFRARAVYRGKSDILIKLTTRSGRKFKITPVHKLFAYSDLNEKRIEAGKLKKGDYLIMPRHLPQGEEIKNELPWREIFADFRLAEPARLRDFRGVLEKLKAVHGSLKKVSVLLDINYACLIEYYSGRNLPTLKFFDSVYKFAGMKIPDVFYVKGQTTSPVTRIPHKLDEKLSSLLALISGDGQVKGRSVRFYNNDAGLRKLFRNLVREIFDLSSKEHKMPTVEVIITESPVMKKLLDYFGFPEYKKSRNITLPKGILASPDKTLAKYLACYFLCDGYFNAQKGEIEIATSSRNMARDMGYLLLKLGISASFKKRNTGGFTSWRIFIRGRAEIEKFYKECFLSGTIKFAKIKKYLESGKKPYNSWDVVPMSKDFVNGIYDFSGRPYAKWKKAGIEIHNYIAGENMGVGMFRKLAEISGRKELRQYAYNHLSSVFIDEITGVEIIKNPSGRVYDIEVEDAHNFIGGEAPAFYSNTVVLHQLAKWSDADVVVYVGCGERGNEMTDVLTEFPELIDPRSGRPLLERTVLIANTSNMPVAAREASIYTGITIAEYFRNQGMDVAVMADSTSRWAEALREMSGRLEEMPGEEGYPAYLTSRIAGFYERSGIVEVGSPPRRGSVSVIGAVSPPGGDLSDPVVQATLRMVKVFWSLESSLAYQRHFPAINWLNSYSLYIDDITGFYEKHDMKEFPAMRKKALKILQEESDLQEIVRLVGVESISDEDRLILETAKIIREDFLHQHAFDAQDAYTAVSKQVKMMEIIMLFHERAEKAIKKGVPIKQIVDVPCKEKIAKMKIMEEAELSGVEKILKDDFASLEGASGGQV